MDQEYITKKQFNEFMDYIKKEIEILKESNNNNNKIFKEIKKNQEKNDIITNKLVDKIINTIKYKSDNDIPNNRSRIESNNILQKEEEQEESKSVNSNKKEKKRKRRKKNNLIPNIEKIRYIVLKDIEENILYKYSLSKVYNDQNIYYYCSDTLSKGRFKILYDFKLSSKLIDKININKIEITSNHTLDKEEHNYIINREIKYDIKNESISNIKNKMKNYKYLYKIIKEEG